MPPLILLFVAAAGAVFGAKAIKREWARVNHELDRSERASAAADKDARPTLKHDPATGQWRPQ